MHNNPFLNITLGLQHGSYNTPARDYRPIGDAREIETVDRNPYKYKYQGQERQDELGLNWDSFKWRNYDYAIGRFMSIDPLSEEYVYNSPYAFQENKMGLGRELEGLELAEGDNMKYNRKIGLSNLYQLQWFKKFSFNCYKHRGNDKLRNRMKPLFR